jgi:hypothetical protein
MVILVCHVHYCTYYCVLSTAESSTVLNPVHAINVNVNLDNGPAIINISDRCGCRCR